MPSVTFPPARPRFRSSLRAFTLIELLTVIAIIGILAAIIIPVVGKVRQTARRAQVLSNLRQLQMASITYADENRGIYLPLRDSASRPGNTLQWYANPIFNQRYLNPGQGSGQWDLTEGVRDSRAASAAADKQYAMNMTEIPGGWNGVGGISAHRVGKIARPSRTIAFVTSDNWLFELGTAAHAASLAGRAEDGKAEIVRFDGSTALEKLDTLRSTAEADAIVWRAL